MRDEVGKGKPGLNCRSLLIMKVPPYSIVCRGTMQERGWSKKAPISLDCYSHGSFFLSGNAGQIIKKSMLFLKWNLFRNLIMP